MAARSRRERVVEALGTITLIALVCACNGNGDGDGGGGATQPPPEGAPTATITFPPDGALTDAASLVVRGTAEDAEGVASVAVNGVAAMSSDGFATWSVTVPLVAGDNQLVVRATDVDGITNASAATASVRRTDVLLAEPVGLLIDGVAGTALIVDAGLRAVVSVALANGARSILSGLDVGSGPEFESPRGITRNIAFGMTLVADAEAQAVLRVDDDGTRSLFSATPPGPFEPDDVSLGLSLGELYVSEPVRSFVHVVDTNDGTRRPLSGPGFGVGPAFDLPTGIAVDVLAFRLLVVDPGARALFSAHLGNGMRTVVSGPGVGSGPAFEEPREIA